MNPPEQDAQRVFAGRHCNQMNVIAHQAISENPDSSFSEVLLYQTEVGEPVLIFRENFAPVYAPLGNVARYFWQDTSVPPWHE